MHFFKYTDQAREWRWRLVGANGRTLADSGEGYQAEASCNHAISLIRGGAGAAEVRRKDNTKSAGYVRDPAFHSAVPSGTILANALRQQGRF